MRLVELNLESYPEFLTVYFDIAFTALIACFQNLAKFFAPNAQHNQVCVFLRVEINCSCPMAYMIEALCEPFPIASVLKLAFNLFSEKDILQKVPPMKSNQQHFLCFA